MSRLSSQMSWKTLAWACIEPAAMELLSGLRRLSWLVLLQIMSSQQSLPLHVDNNNVLPEHHCWYLFGYAESACIIQQSTVFIAGVHVRLLEPREIFAYVVI